MLIKKKVSKFYKNVKKSKCAQVNCSGCGKLKHFKKMCRFKNVNFDRGHRFNYRGRGFSGSDDVNDTVLEILIYENKIITTIVMTQVVVFVLQLHIILIQQAIMTKQGKVYPKKF